MVKKNIWSGIFVAITCISVEMTSLAAATSELEDMRKYTKIKERQRIQEIIQSPNSRDYIGVLEENESFEKCVDCAWLSVSVCTAEATTGEKGYHAGVSGRQTKEDVECLKNGGVEVCPACYGLARHD